MQRSSARHLAAVLALLLTACASLAAFQALGDEHGSALADATAARGLSIAMGPMALHSRLDAVSDGTRLLRTASNRGPRWLGLPAAGLLLAVAAVGRTASGARRGAGQLALTGSASSRAPPSILLP